MTLTPGENEWVRFLNELDEARVILRCSMSSAWYRGHSNHEWPLIPSVFRNYLRPEAIGRTADYDGLKTRLEQASGLRYPNLINLSGPQIAKVNQLLQEVGSSILLANASNRALKDLKFLKSEALGSRGSPPRLPVIDIARVVRICAVNKINIPIGGAKASIQNYLQAIDLVELDELIDEAEKRLKADRTNLQARKTELQRVVAVVPGEKEAFVEFRFRWREPVDTSWQLLALMQHYGVHTRLLDWTESPAVALSFALRRYIKIYQAKRKKNNTISQDIQLALPEVHKQASDENDPLREPCIWVMNPYVLAEQATGHRTILDLDLQEIDYFETFHRKGWPFEKPLPIYSPWRNARLSSQHAMFTVHGLSLLDLAEQTKLSKGKNGTVQKLWLSKEAALYGAAQMTNLFPLDKYSLFRDMDSLGEIINEKFIL